LTSAKGPTLGKEFWAGGTVNGSIYAPAAQERAIGGIDDHIDGLTRNIALECFDEQCPHPHFPTPRSASRDQI
jgi:hypothetical protein